MKYDILFETYIYYFHFNKILVGIREVQKQTQPCLIFSIDS